MKKIIKNMDFPLMVFVILMCIIGIFAILSASSVKSALYSETGTPYYYFRKQLIFVIGSLICGGIVFGFKTKDIEKLTPLITIGGFMMLILVLFIGETVNGTKGWINLGFMSLQPSEFIKLIMILYMGYFFRNPNIKMNHAQMIAFVGPILAALLLVYLEGDFGTTAILGLLLLVTFVFIPLKNDLLVRIARWGLGAVAIFGVALLVVGVNFFDGYRAERFKTKEPCQRYYEVGTGYQVCNGYIAMNNGGFFGVGIGNSTQKYLYLPEAHTDFIFPIIVEEIGVIPSIGIILMYVLILVRIYLIATHANNLRNSIIAFGIFLYFSIHFVVNLGGVLSIIPLTGVPLLFLSYGGSSCLTALVSIFIVQRIAAESKIERNLRKIREI